MGIGANPHIGFLCPISGAIIGAVLEAVNVWNTSPHCNPVAPVTPPGMVDTNPGTINP